MRRLMIATLSSLLVLAGCGGDSDSASLDGISVSDAATPKVEGAKGTKTTKTESKVVKKGSGDEIAEGDSVKLNYLAINGRTGKQFDSSYATGKASTFTMTEEATLPGFTKSLVGKQVGSRVLALVPPKDGFNAERTEFDLKKSDTLVFVFDIVAKVPTSAEGKSKDLPSDLPELQLNDKDEPEKFVATDDTAKKQSKASAHVLIEGKGDKVKLDQNITVQYHGQIYPEGKVFDTSWGRGSTSFQLSEGSLIKCWTDLLPGQRIGSRVALVCPSDVAYGDEGSPPDIKGGDTLIFAIDLLDAS